MKKLRVVKFDPQREALFKMEREFEGCLIHHSAPKNFLVKKANEICDYYGVLRVKLYFVRQRSDMYGWTESSHDQDYARTKIFLNEGRKGATGKNLPTLVHELAHHIVDSVYDYAEAHGPEFCAVYMHLMNKYKLMSEDCFRLSARRWGIKIAPEYLPSALHFSR